MAEYRLLLAAKPDQPEALNNLAWLLATSPDAAVRDGAEAVRLAEQGCRLTDYKQAQMLGTLAAAYAEAGRFTEAVTTAQKAIELARAGGDMQFAAANAQLLSLYRAGRPYHEPPPTTAPPGAQ
jgi:tetratricopeptide (TPR) repeat protein